MTNIHNHEMLEEITQEFASIVKKLWYQHSKYVNITKYGGIKNATGIWLYIKYPEKNRLDQI